MSEWIRVQLRYTGINKSIRGEDTRLAIQFACSQSRPVVAARRPALKYKSSLYWLPLIHGSEDLFHCEAKIKQRFITFNQEFSIFLRLEETNVCKHWRRIHV